MASILSRPQCVNSFPLAYCGSSNGLVPSVKKPLLELITWTNLYPLLMGFPGIELRSISQKALKISIPTLDSKITLLEV